MEHVSNNNQCEWFCRTIDGYLDGEVDAREKATFEEHAHRCVTCRAELDLAQEVLGSLRSLPEHTCPDHVLERALSEVAVADTGPPADSWSRRWLGLERLSWRVVFVSTFVLVAVVSASILLRRGHRPVEQISAEELAEAEGAVKWTFAYIGEVGRRTGHTIKSDVFDNRIFPTMERALWNAVDGDAQKDRQESNGGSV